MNRAMIEALYIAELKRAQERFDAAIRVAEYTKQDRLAALAIHEKTEKDGKMRNMSCQELSEEGWIWGLWCPKEQQWDGVTVFRDDAEKWIEHYFDVYELQTGKKMERKRWTIL